MHDYLKKHTTQAAYTTWTASNDYVTPNVSLIEADGSLAYNPYVAVASSYNMLDILWSDGTATQTVRPTTDGVTPIGLCVAPTGFFGANEPARFMALKYAGASSWGDAPGNARTTHNDQKLKWALQTGLTDVTGLTNYSQLTSTTNDGIILADYQGGFIGDEYDAPIMLYTEHNTWEGLEPNNIFTGYALSDINGKLNTTTVANLGSLSNYPAFASVLNYYTPDTQAGDWYIPALGELALIVVNQSRINPVLNSISSLYNADCMSAIYNDDDAIYWSSTEYGSYHAFNIEFYSGFCFENSKNSIKYVIPMLQK